MARKATSGKIWMTRNAYAFKAFRIYHMVMRDNKRHFMLITFVLTFFLTLKSMNTFSNLKTCDGPFAFSSLKIPFANESKAVASTEFSFDHPDLQLKTEGIEWSIWDRNTVLIDDENKLYCDWVKYTTFLNPCHEAGEKCCDMCVVPGKWNDFWISQTIRTKGRWDQCDDITQLITLFNEKKRNNSLNSNNTEVTPTGLYVDVGTNLGSCLLHVLLTFPQYHAMAFEPNRGNLFYLTSTLSRLPLEMREKIMLFPIALGATETTANMKVNKFNRGNAMILSSTKNDEFIPTLFKKLWEHKFFTFKKWSEDMFFWEDTFMGYDHPASNIHVEKLDDIIQIASSPETQLKINFLKLDAEGFECHIVQGMKKLLTDHVIEQILYENIPRYLASYGCEADEVFNTLRDAGYHQYQYPPTKYPEVLTEYPHGSIHVDIWAVSPKI